MGAYFGDADGADRIGRISSGMECICTYCDESEVSTVRDVESQPAPVIVADRSAAPLGVPRRSGRHRSASAIDGAMTTVR